ncbi:MAG TPA: aminotransferase class V-fold PLP-dependent enzyme [Gammaproteobacteria bacterium]|nr:aminotransferase class V-fold PLP-dependent enzyme [Gammaproteobacteria bacterium]
MKGKDLLGRTTELARSFLDSLEERPVRPAADLAELRASLVTPLPEHGEDPLTVVEELARRADPGLVAMAGPRYFGFVIGGHLPAALAADWLTSTWDQNAGIYAAGPAASVVEEAVGAWLIDLFGLPRHTSFGLVTGGQTANTTCLAAARHGVLQRTGWDVEERGLFGAPEIEVIIGAEAHATIPTALQYLGLGRSRVTIVPTDDQGRVRADALAAALPASRDRPLIVCLQAGNVNTGAFDPFAEAIAAIRRAQPEAWVHVDGAFGLWAAAVPPLRHLVRGMDQADSWSVDGHKWLNVPYDSGFALVARPESHRAAMAPASAAYIEYGAAERDPFSWVPEFSRRARGFASYDALRSLGRSGLVEMIERACTIARSMADALAAEPGIEVLNDVVLNQALVRFSPPDGGDDDAFTRSVIHRVQEEGTCWMSGTTWHGMAAMRISVSNWSTTEADGRRSVEAILRCARRIASA